MTNPSSMYRVELRWLLDRQLMHEKVAVARELPAASQQPEHYSNWLLPAPPLHGSSSGLFWQSTCCYFL